MRVIARIVKAVEVSDVAQKVLLDFYTQEKEGSLENYRAALLRCRREPTYREYVATSSKLKRELKDRVCKQQQRSFPKLLQNAACPGHAAPMQALSKPVATHRGVSGAGRADASTL